MSTSARCLCLATLLLNGAAHAQGAQEAQTHDSSELPATWRVLVEEADQHKTELALPRLEAVVLNGQWVQRTSMWDDTALVYAEDGKSLYVLEGGQEVPKRLWGNAGQDTYFRHPVWSEDGKTLYMWLDQDLQLCAIDLKSGVIRSLTSLDSHIWHIEWMFHLDPTPYFHSRAPVEDPDSGQLLFMIREEFNEEVALWQRRAGRGGSWLTAVDVRNATMQPRMGKRLLLPRIQSWDLSLERDRLFTIGEELRTTWPPTTSFLEERRLNGTLLRELSVLDGGLSSLQLSSDGTQLLVERHFKPGVPWPRKSWDDYTREDHSALRAALDGGFYVIDLESDVITDGPHYGHQPRWVPPGEHVVFVDEWSVLLAALREHTVSPLISGGARPRNWYWGTWNDLVLSPDGGRLALRAGGMDYTLLLDLTRREYIVMEADVTMKTWAPVPRPFKTKVIFVQK